MTAVDAVTGLAGRYPAYTVAAVVVALALAAVAVWAVRRACRGRTPEDVLTLLAAVIATVVAMSGMWRFFADVLHVAGPLRVLTFAFIEIAVFASALRARRNVRETPGHSAGVDGAAVWALTGLSAVLSALDAGGVRGALLRLAAPLVAAWLWERSMAVERRRATGRRVNWRISPERVLIRLGLAEATDRAVTEVDAHRRLAKVARRAKRLRVLRTAGAAGWRQRRAVRRLDAASTKAVDRAGLAVDSGRQAVLMAQLGALYHATTLAELSPPAPWDPPVVDEEPHDVEAPGGYALWDQVPAVVDEPPGPVEEDRPAPVVDSVPVPATAPIEVPEVPAPVRVPAVPDVHHVAAVERFGDQVRDGRVPGVREIKRQLRIGQPKAQQVREYLTALATK